jgi:hypothetical protein
MAGRPPRRQSPFRLLLEPLPAGADWKVRRRAQTCPYPHRHNVVTCAGVPQLVRDFFRGVADVSFAEMLGPVRGAAEFATAEAMRAALARLDGTIVHGQAVRLREVERRISG